MKKYYKDVTKLYASNNLDRNWVRIIMIKKRSKIIVLKKLANPRAEVARIANLY